MFYTESKNDIRTYFMFFSPARTTNMHARDFKYWSILSVLLGFIQGAVFCAHPCFED